MTGPVSAPVSSSRLRMDTGNRLLFVDRRGVREQWLETCPPVDSEY